MLQGKTYTRYVLYVAPKAAFDKTCSFLYYLPKYLLAENTILRNIMTETANKKPDNAKQKKQITTILIVAAVIAGIILWHKVLEDRVIPKKFGVVKAGSIYRSGQISQYLIADVLEKHNIEVIVDLNLKKADDPDQDAEAAAAEKLGIDILRFPMDGYGVGSIENYAGAVAAVDRAVKENKPVLVHCNAGAQRTGGVIATYRLLVEGKDIDFILKEMRKYGWRDYKNPKLLDFLNANLPQIAQQLYEMNVIAEPSLSEPVFPE